MTDTNADTTARKRIPKSIGTETKLIGQYTFSDLAVAIAPGALVVLAAQMVLPETQVGGYSLQALALPVAALAIGIGALFVSLTPAHVSSVTWLSSLVSYLQTAPDVDYREATHHTRFERVYPEYDAIERTDGALVGALQVSPTRMALATDEQWHQTARAFTDVLNTTVEFPIQIYSTTQSFPAETYLAQYEQRLEDPDVEANPTLERLIEQYVEWYRKELERRQMTIRDHYVIVPVSPASVRHDESGVTERLSSIPVLGVFIDAFTASRAAEERAAMLSELDDRLRDLERGIRGLENCSVTRVSAPEFVDLLTEYWTDTPTDGERARTLRTTPLVRGPRR
jgi:hypothetical protein